MNRDTGKRNTGKQSTGNTFTDRKAAGSRNSGSKNAGSKSTERKNIGDKYIGKKTTDKKFTSSKFTSNKAARYESEEGSGRSDFKKTDFHKNDSRKTDSRKFDFKNTDAKRADSKKSDFKNTDAKRADSRKFDFKNTDAKRADSRKSDFKNTDAKRADSRKSDFKNTDAKRADSRKSDYKNTDSKPQTAKRRKSACPISDKCGGCAYQHLKYDEQCQIKEKKVQQLLREICKVDPIMRMENPYHYRNKVSAAFAHKRDNTIVSGVYAQGTHQVVPVEECLIEDKKADQIIGDIRGLLKSFKITVYSEDSGYGLLRHVLIRRGFASGQILVVLVTVSPIFPSKNNFVKALRKIHPEITSIVLNVNDKDTSMVFGERNIPIYGKGYIEDSLCGCVFRISPSSFYQVNPVQTERIYQKAIDLAGLTGTERVLDAYCGIGTIGLIAAPHAKEILGVELNAEAVRDARSNAKRNNIANARFIQGDAGEVMVKMAEQEEHIDVVFMDPPRSGSDEAFLSSIVKLNPKKVVYISCNPETLARDLTYMKKQGYRIGTATPADMFPWTSHVETVVSLVRKNPDAYIDLTVDMDELDLTAAEAKATYKEIKQYILDKYDVKVSSLYVAQVKHKHGIIERENFNKAQSDESKQPQCTPEKERMIEEALQYFKMI